MCNFNFAMLNSKNLSSRQTIYTLADDLQLALVVSGFLPVRSASFTCFVRRCLLATVCYTFYLSKNNRTLTMKSGLAFAVYGMFALLATFSSSFAGTDVTTEITKADYRAAARFTPSKLDKMVFSTAVEANWLEGKESFWYDYKTSEGTFYYLVDAARQTKKLLFDNAKMAAELSMIVKDAYDAQHLPIEKLEFIESDRVIRFEVTSSIDEDSNKIDVENNKNIGSKKEDDTSGNEKAETKKKVFAFTYDIVSGQLTWLQDENGKKEQPDWASPSPDGSKVAFVRGDNLYWMDRENYKKALADEKDESIVEHQITTDGVEHYNYAGGIYSAGERRRSDEKEEDRNKRKKATVSWSHDSGKLALTRYDYRKVNDLWVIDTLAEPRPVLTSYRYSMPGEEHVPQYELWVFDLKNNKNVKIKTERFTDQTLLFINERDLQFDYSTRNIMKQLKAVANQTFKWISPDNNKIYFYRVSRDFKKADLMVADTNTGESKVLVEERSNVYTYYYVFSRVPFHLVNGGREMIVWSERSGWAQLYLYDNNGNLKNPVTSGSYHVSDILGVDEKKRVVYFVANGKEKGEDPYYEHLYRVNFDGSGLKLLNPGDYTHKASLSKSTKYFVNNYSRVNTTPKSELRDSNGKLLMTLETADLSLLMDAGFKFPETFKVKADDSVTDLYGVMYKPYNFDPEKKYPIIAYVYPGPQTESVAKAFDLSFYSNHLPMLAQFGYVVVTVGNRGGHPQRSNWYQTFSTGNLRDYGLPDKKAAIEQLADRHNFINIEKVGIFGHSGGGFMSTAAMLTYPDFFHVAVSSAGNHENNIYNTVWSELHHGVKEVVDKDGNTKFEYMIQKNSELADNLKGHLMLATGAVDDNVHPGLTYRMAQALIKANKRFDFFLLPGQAHAFTTDEEYFNWIRADYFNKHLIGDYSDSVDITEMNREIQLKSIGVKRQ